MYLANIILLVLIERVFLSRKHGKAGKYSYVWKKPLPLHSYGLTGKRQGTMKVGRSRQNIILQASLSRGIIYWL
jgi:hypothetical protein